MRTDVRTTLRPPGLDERPRKQRIGAVTGAKIAQLLREEGPMPAKSIAMELNLDESYVRRTCWALKDEGLLLVEIHKQPGTPDIAVFAAI